LYHLFRAPNECPQRSCFSKTVIDFHANIEGLLNGTIKQDYIYQMAGGCFVYGRDWWDFVSFDPRLPENLQSFCRRFNRDELPIQEVKEGATKFLEELAALEAKIRAWK